LVDTKAACTRSYFWSGEMIANTLRINHRRPINVCFQIVDGERVSI
jgi:hypothetical protein